MLKLNQKVRQNKTNNKKSALTVYIFVIVTLFLWYPIF